ncbi:sulfotransferase [soil metagenome]
MSKNISSIPDFIIAGAPKCGTTALAFFLSEHPEVCISRIKEPRFFTKLKGDMEKTIEGDGPRLSGNYEKGFEWYGALFETAVSGQLKGEASTVYFCNEDAADLIHKHVPDVKLVFMLREPVNRLYSHYWQEYKLGFDFPSFDEMVNTSNPRLLYYKRISAYKDNLMRYLQLFKPLQIHIIIQEEFERDTEGHFKKVQQFLGLNYHEVDLNKRVNDQVAPKNRKIARLLTVLQSSKMKKIIPEKVLEKTGQWRKKLFKFNATSFKYPPMPETLYDSLKETFEKDIVYVEQLLGRKIEDWQKQQN